MINHMEKTEMDKELIEDKLHQSIKQVRSN